MVKEVLDFFDVAKGKRYIDCTLGDGGHSIEILKRGGLVLGLEVNEAQFAKALERIKGEGLEANFIGEIGNFKYIENLALKHNFSEIDGILFDLGYSSSELEEGNLGLSFSTDGVLDMRLDKSLSVTAADLVNTLSQKSLEKLFFEYGQEKMSRKFVEAIINARKLKKIQTTKELSDLLVSEAPLNYENKRMHPATRVFQALRIAVNTELENLSLSLPRAARLLKRSLPGGRMIVISFHSLEDKIAKDFGRNARLVVRELTKKPLTPLRSEVEENRRSRSAKMRIFEKI